MKIKALIEETKPENTEPLRTWLDTKPETVLFQGIPLDYLSLSAYSILKRENRPVLIISNDKNRVNTISQELSSLSEEKIHTDIPSRDSVPYSMNSPFGPVTESRLNALRDLADNKTQIYLSSPAALMQKTPEPKSVYRRCMFLSRGDEIQRNELEKALFENFYTREASVSEIGTYSVKGNIIDIYPYFSEYPVRLDFWGDSIESIRSFDVFTQNSVSEIKTAVIPPVKEFFVSDEDMEDAVEKMEGEFGSNHKGIKRLRHSWLSMEDFEGIEWFLSYFPVYQRSFLESMPEDTLIIWDDYLDPEVRFKEVYDNYERHLENVPEVLQDLVSKPGELLVNQEELARSIYEYSMIYINTNSLTEETPLLESGTTEQQKIPPHYEALKKLLRYNSNHDIESIISCISETEAERVSDLLSEDEIDVTLCLGYLDRGYIDKAQNFSLLSSNIIFKNREDSGKRKSTSRNRFSVEEFSSLEYGDIVVHDDHGIGRFVRIANIDTGVSTTDCIVLEYKNSDKVFIPIEKIHKLQKYIGNTENPPALSKLGSSTWQKKKEETKKAIEKIVDELVSLYTKRKYFNGIAFSDDTVMKQEFEEAFIHEPTQDQIRAIKEVETDMEKSIPMDRLICGDVGFGKTEVAARAAYKAVCSGYQVSMIVPTTILADQHYETFKKRFSDFPVNIGVLSRFAKERERRETIKKMNKGELDIVIGTHRLLSKDIKFSNLGLLIIDEEQRFGVKHKEKLKLYRNEIDVLSMTATPIPRTLHMSLSGIRDLSIINTPPRNRLPVETHVREYRDEHLKSAVKEEMSRGGQCYIVCRKIRELEAVKRKVELLVPEAEVAVSHGQMEEENLESAINRFKQGRSDVLITTTIIENGIDISNVNTIFIVNAHNFGLSQLYQLKGRVGRSSQQAFAYITVPSFKKVNERSVKRLKALEQYTDLGSGFQIAMRDLEIRGAGSLLGTNQSGSIRNVGFEMYSRMLKERLEEIKGEVDTHNRDRNIDIEIPYDAYIPSDYINDPSQRIKVYRKCSDSQRISDLKEIKNSVTDQYGIVPEKADNLFFKFCIRAVCSEAGIDSFSIDEKGIIYIGMDKPDKERLTKVLSALPEQKEIKYSERITIVVAIGQGEIKRKVHDLLRNIEEIS